MVAEQVESRAEPRWLTAGPPYEFTRAELLEALAILGNPISDGHLRSWANRGLLPPPSRRTVPPGATDGIVRALYPVWTVALLARLLDRSQRNETIEQLRTALPEELRELERWAGRDHGVDLLMKTRLIGIQADGQPFARRPDEGWPTATLTMLAPKITRDLQRAAWECAEDYVTRAHGMRRVDHVVMVIFDEDGRRITTEIPPPPSRTVRVGDEETRTNTIET